MISRVVEDVKNSHVGEGPLDMKEALAAENQDGVLHLALSLILQVLALAQGATESYTIVEQQLCHRTTRVYYMSALVRQLQLH
jgi:hypothetical protein